MRDWLKKRGKVTARAARKITGISSPLGGIQWADPGPADGEIVRKFILFLEDRRVLYNAMEMEIVEQVGNSIHDIRRECTEALQTLPTRAFAVNPIRVIRAACRRFHDDQIQWPEFFDGRWLLPSGGSPAFFLALGSFRATVGQQVALLAAHYDIDVEGDLASVLPIVDVDGE